MGCMIPFTYCNRLRYDTGTMVSVDSKGLQSLDDNPFHQACHVTSPVFVWGQGSTKGSAVRRQEIKPETDAGSVVWAKTKGYPWWPAQVVLLSCMPPCGMPSAVEALIEFAMIRLSDAGLPAHLAVSHLLSLMFSAAVSA